MSQQSPKPLLQPSQPVPRQQQPPSPAKVELQKIQRQLHHLVDRVKGLQEKIG